SHNVWAAPISYGIMKWPCPSFTPCLLCHLKLPIYATTCKHLLIWRIFGRKRGAVFLPLPHRNPAIERNRSDGRSDNDCSQRASSRAHLGDRLTWPSLLGAWGTRTSETS